MVRLMFLSFISILALTVQAIVPTPGAKQSEPILVKGGTLHLGNGAVIENGAMAFVDGKITFVGASAEAPSGSYKEIDATGKHIYPGFILAANGIGLTEVGAVKAMRDANETGEVNPNVRAIAAYNTDSEYIPATRFNGILTAQSTPSGGPLMGTSSVVQLDAWTWEDAVVKLDDGLHLAWPDAVSASFDFSTFSRVRKPNKNFDKEMQDLRMLFQEAKAYAKKAADTPTNLKLASLLPLFEGKATLFVHTNSAKAMVNAVKFSRDRGIAKVVIVGGEEAYLVSEFLAKESVPVLLDNILRLPDTSADPLWAPFKLPAQLHMAGVLVGLFESSAMNGRNLPFMAGHTVAHGLTKAEALQLVTSNVAKILGIDEQLGSLAKDKHATFFISTGDALDMRSQIIEHAFIDGREVNLQGMQQQLFDKYKTRYDIND